MLEVVAAICALALGRVVDAPLVLFPLAGDAVSTAQSRRRDLSIPGLARDGVSLDIFGELVALADFDGLLRARGALLSYHAALQQSSSDVALMLFVTSLEALITPRPE